jgi:EAL domain-containing protein (putative c-di-GMP-specific phosphodiesterase class I)
MTTTPSARAIDRQFEQVLTDREVQTVFQPVVHLPSRAVVGYEALIRGPQGTALTTPDALIAAAERTGRLVELDWAARASACRAAVEAELDTDQMLLLNFEPIALNSDCPSDIWPDIERGFHAFRVVLEVTERSLDRDPGALLEGVERQRTQVAGIGMDDVGSNPSTLAFLPLVSPNVIKIDRTVIHATPDAEVAKVFSAVHQESQHTGAIVLAEGIEIDEHRRHALAQGAHVGQGILFGRPGPLPNPSLRPSHRAPLRRNSPMSVVSPYDALSAQVDGTGGDDLLLALTNDLAAFAEASMPVLYASLIPARRSLAEEDLRRLGRMADGGAFVTVVGAQVPPDPGYGVRGIGGRLDPLPRNEWAAIAIGPGLSAAVLARRIPDTDEWTFGVTHDPLRVAAAARSVVRLLGAPGPARTL